MKKSTAEVVGSLIVGVIGAVLTVIVAFIWSLLSLAKKS